MVIASQLRPGMAIRFEGQNFKVLSAEYHPGQGKMSGQTHTRLKNLGTGTQWEHAFRADLRLDDLPIEKKPVDYLYADSGFCIFMDPVSGEQYEVPVAVVGPQADFLSSDLKVSVEFIDSRPVSVLLPDNAEVEIADTAPSAHAQQDSNFKSAKLANGVMVMVPQFIKTGDFIRLGLATLKYMDRARSTGK